MKSSVYIESSIPSFYYEIRTEPDIVSRKAWTVIWWDEYRFDYDLVTSIAVLDELNTGYYPNQNKVIEPVDELPSLPMVQEILEIVQYYISNFVMPNNPVGDAIHLALASFYKCDYLLTWNCKHLANANKFRHIQRINTILGLYVPFLVTPLELLGGKSDAVR